MAKISILTVVIVVQIFSFGLSQSNAANNHCILDSYQERKNFDLVSTIATENSGVKAWLKKFREYMFRGFPSYFSGRDKECLKKIYNCALWKRNMTEFECIDVQVWQARVPSSMEEGNDEHRSAEILECKTFMKPNGDQQNVKIAEDSNGNKPSESFALMLGLRKKFWNWETTYDVYVGQPKVNKSDDEEDFILKGVFKNFNLYQACISTSSVISVIKSKFKMSPP